MWAGWQGWARGVLWVGFAMFLGACQRPLSDETAPAPRSVCRPPASALPSGGGPGRLASAAAAPALALDFDVALFSKYVWRGLIVTDGPVLQPSATARYGDVSLNVWGNIDLDDANDLAGTPSEVDVGLTYDRSFETGDLSWSVTAGAIGYFFPNTALPATAEVFAGVAADIPLQPSLTVFWDFVEIDGVYATADVSHSIAICAPGCGPIHVPEVSLDLSAGVGWGSAPWNRSLHGVDGSALNDLHASAALPFVFFDGRLTVTPVVALSYLVDADLRAVRGRGWVVYGGVTASFTF